MNNYQNAYHTLQKSKSPDIKAYDVREYDCKELKEALLIKINLEK